MGKSKNKKRLCDDWERIQGENHFHRLFDSFIDSPAFLDLNHRQQMLLIRFMQRCTFIPHDDGSFETNNGNIHFAQSEWVKFYGYRDTDIWGNDLEALQTHGFIKVTFQGQNMFHPSRYMLLTDWQQWSKNTKEVSNVESATAAKRTKRNAKRNDK